MELNKIAKRTEQDISSLKALILPQLNQRGLDDNSSGYLETNIA